MTSINPYNLEGVIQFRPVAPNVKLIHGILKSNILYRASDITNASKRDIEKLKLLKIKTYIDFRGGISFNVNSNNENNDSNVRHEREGIDTAEVFKIFKTIVHAPLFEGAMEASGGVDFNGFKGRTLDEPNKVTIRENEWKRQKSMMPFPINYEVLDSVNLNPVNFLVPDPISKSWIPLVKIKKRQTLVNFIYALELDRDAEWVDCKCVDIEKIDEYSINNLLNILSQRKVLQVWGFALEIVLNRQGADSGSLAVIMWNRHEEDTEERQAFMNIDSLSNNLTQRHYKTFFDIISDINNYPIVFGCSAGKDRTGLASALLLSTLGANLEDIQKDYILSQKAAPLLANQMTPMLKLQYHENFEADPYQQQLANWTPAGAVKGSLQFLKNKHGSVVDFLKYIGVNDEQIMKIHAILIEPTVNKAAL